MSESILYRQIAAEIKEDILEGRLKRGERLPSIRELSQKWKCTAGTIQRAFAELAEANLIISHAGKGTHVVDGADKQLSDRQSPLWMANLVHQAEGFLLEAITMGYTPEEVRKSLEIAADRWRSIKPLVLIQDTGSSIRFSGSHDQVITWLAEHFGQVSPDGSLEVVFNGSLNGLLHLAEGKADIAGSHLWDAETDQYNLPFLPKLFPGKAMASIHLSKRNLGFILRPGNPKRIFEIKDLFQRDIHMVNRQSGSGTRVWFDARLLEAGYTGRSIPGYDLEVSTHNEVARLIAENKADVGIGLQSAAAFYGLDYVHLTKENYDLICYQHSLDNPIIRHLIDWLTKSSKLDIFTDFCGYDFSSAGKITYLHA